ncbi:hypothetical protein AR457_02020 [Streptomyces agglomeratus]|uniref:Uncharacterized protein n=1 Tax=Streptomyces agglomeratus TaxID=285458 RepID=A0A1E5P1S8_9ACTN|nr:hypothetical protein AS594_02125 [Streptomyces agglomeratus]OEJ43055.1 hypothetical protein AR457_02020 [Streptomyces agglomeratus]OEJ62395.1 hypothetical protein BGM19_34680 [Streptomyces agglomeratus]
MERFRQLHVFDTVDFRQASEIAGGDRRGQDIPRGHTHPRASIGNLATLFFTGFPLHPDEHLEGSGADRLTDIRQRTPCGGAELVSTHLSHLIR